MRPPPSALLLLVIILASVGGCSDHRRHAPPPLPWVNAPVPADAAPLVHPLSGFDLEPGSDRAFGVLLPAVAVPQFRSESVQMFAVMAPMPRVMSYLQRRLEIVNADIHPLAVMVRGAHVLTAEPGTDYFVDVGVRDEGDHTLVSIWNRTTAPVPARSMDDGLRAAGFDPTSKRPVGENNN